MPPRAPPPPPPPRAPYALSWLPNCLSRSPDCPSSLPNGSRRSDGVVGPDGHLLGLLERPEAGERRRGLRQHQQPGRWQGHQQPLALAAPPERISCDAARPAGPLGRAGRRHGGRAGGLGGQPAGFAGVSPPHAPRTRPEAVATPVRDFLARGRARTARLTRSPKSQGQPWGAPRPGTAEEAAVGPAQLLRRSRGCPRARGGTGGGTRPPRNRLSREAAPRPETRAGA